jgi:hypothetical protein
MILKSFGHSVEATELKDWSHLFSYDYFEIRDICDAFFPYLSSSTPIHSIFVFDSKYILHHITAYSTVFILDGSKLLSPTEEAQKRHNSLSSYVYFDGQILAPLISSIREYIGNPIILRYISNDVFLDGTFIVDCQSELDSLISNMW